MGLWIGLCVQYVDSYQVVHLEVSNKCIKCSPFFQKKLLSIYCDSDTVVVVGDIDKQDLLLLRL